MTKEFEYIGKNGHTYFVEVDFDTVVDYPYGYAGERQTYADIEDIVIYDETTGLEVTPDTDNRVFREIERYVDNLALEGDNEVEGLDGTFDCFD